MPGVRDAAGGHGGGRPDALARRGRGRASRGDNFREVPPLDVHSPPTHPSAMLALLGDPTNSSLLLLAVGTHNGVLNSVGHSGTIIFGRTSKLHRAES